MLLDLSLTEVNIAVETLVINSESLKRDVSCVIYYPEISQINQSFHLLVMNDGQDLETMHYDQILNHLYNKNQLCPVLTVGIKAGNRLREYGIASQPDFKGRGDQAKKHQHFITDELLPAIFEKTNISSFASTAIAGFSLGALSAFDIAWNKPHVFSKVGAFSGSFWWRSKALKNGYTDEDRIAHKMIRESQTKPNLKFWFMAGTQDEISDRNNNGISDSVDDTTDMIYELYQKGYKRETDINYIELVGGKHDVPTWGKIMPKFLMWAFGRK